MERCRTNNERLEADLAFHQCIFRASGNRICHLLFNVIHRSVLTSMYQLSTRVPLDRPLGFHKRIFAAIQQRNPEEARRQMLEHISDTKTLLPATTK
jgi:DNA-binding FadR family transcriptional regulator